MGYFFHGYAGTQRPDDPKFYDLSGCGNHGVFGDDLPVANAWIDGHVANTDPVASAEDSVIRLPPLNFDFAGGEKLIIWWLGQVTPEGSNASWIGDGLFGVSAGVRVRMNSTGKIQFATYDGTAQDFSVASTDTVGDGTTHSFAVAVDGETKTYGFWVDELMDTAFDGKYVALTATARDTRNNNTFNIGCPAPKSATSVDGIASYTRALVVLRYSQYQTMPSPARFTRVQQALRANPGELIRDESLKYGMTL